MAIYLDKEKFIEKLNNEKDILYDVITNELLNRVFNKKLVNVEDQIQIIASRREVNKFSNKNFIDYLSRQNEKNHNTSISIQIKTPSEEKILQLIDVSVGQYSENMNLTMKLIIN